LRTLLRIGATLLLAAAIAGCGATSTGGASAQPTATTTIPSPALNGCLTQHIPIDGAHADVIVSNAQTSPTQPVSIALNKTLEVRLIATYQWRLQTPAPANVLSLSTLEGWYDDANKTCDWLFAASATGQITLQFSGGLVCAAGVACPAIAAIAQVTVDVTN
jgi:hypothetical protein